MAKKLRKGIAKYLLQNSIESILATVVIKFNASYHHILLCKKYSVRPFSGGDHFEIKTNYCLYKDTYNDYVYTKEWIAFLRDELLPDPIIKIK